ncbi:MAG: FAD-dependent oxidoreductase [Planctomycetota bacterium]
MLSKFFALLLLLSLPASVFCQEKTNYDLLIYGGSSAGITAAVQAKKMGKTVIIVCPDVHLGGLSSGGLGFTDTGRKEVIGGLSREFYHRVWREYQKPETWTQQRQAEFGGRGQGTPAVDGKQRTMWVFEPRIAERVFEDFVREYAIPVHRDEWLNRDGGVEIANGRIQTITTLSGKIYHAKMFIDATYEGDLLATAGVDFTVGREAKDVYGEQWNGIQTGVLHHGHHFDAIPGKVRISPYVVPDDPSSGVLPLVSTDPPGEKHAGDHRVQAYCFRMCLTNAPDNRIPFPKPADYDPNRYELLARVLATGWKEGFRKFDAIPNRKTDTNNHGPVSTDYIGANYDYPEASYQRRNEIISAHESYQKGLMYFLANSSKVPDEIRTKMQQWGFPKDEFTDNGGWPHQLYIREARRMVGHFVMTENELLKRRPTPQSVGMGSYTIDSHNVQRYITPEGYVQNEGDIGVGCSPYQIAFGSLMPKQQECENLLVPVCVSSSHIAFGSIRMEPVFMILGQSAATAACQAIDNEQAVQEVSYEQLRARLLADGQILEFDPVVDSKGIDPRKLPGIVLDDTKATFQGAWASSTSNPTYLGLGYRHDGAAADGQASATFEAKLPSAGKYELRLIYPPNNNRATNVPVEVTYSGGTKTILVDQTKEPPIDELFLSLGEFQFGKTAQVVIRNSSTDGHVIVDGIQLLPLED